MAFTIANMSTDPQAGCPMPPMQQYFFQPGAGDASIQDAMTSPPPMVMAPGSNNTSPGKANNYYTVISNRIFVGSLQSEVDEEILKNLFTPEGIIRESKVIRDNNGQSKGFGFITFQEEKDAVTVLAKPSGSFCFKGRSWNVAPAMRRFNHAPREAQVPALQNVLYYPTYPSGVVRYGNGMMAYPNFVPQQVYSSPSPYITSPMMQQGHFVFPSVPQHFDGISPIGAVNATVGYPTSIITGQPNEATGQLVVVQDEFPPLPSKSTSSDPGNACSTDNNS